MAPRFLKYCTGCPSAPPAPPCGRKSTSTQYWRAAEGSVQCRLQGVTRYPPLHQVPVPNTNSRSQEVGLPVIHGLDLSDVSLRPSIHCSPLRRQRRFGSGSPLHACACLSHDPFPMVRACPITLNRCRSVDDNVGDSHYIRTSLNEVCTLERTFGSSRPISCLKSRPALFISCHLESHNSQSTPRCLRTDVNVDHSPNDSIQRQHLRLLCAAAILA